MIFVIKLHTIKASRSVFNQTRKGDYMALAVKDNYNVALKEQQKEVRDMVLAGLENIKESKTKDFNEVCDRLEKKYRDAAIQNQN